MIMVDSCPAAELFGFQPTAVRGRLAQATGEDAGTSIDVTTDREFLSGFVTHFHYSQAQRNANPAIHWPHRAGGQEFR
jgi:hypothetical protein